MKISIVGISHKSAPVKLRERLAVSRGRLKDALGEFAKSEKADECAVVSTCNRIELYMYLPRSRDAKSVAYAFWSEFSGVRPDELERFVFCFEDGDAVRHSIRVAAGLDSMIFGECEVMGQVREAFQCAREAGATGSVLNGLFQKSLSAAKRIRTETSICSGNLSIGSVAARFAETVFGQLSHRTVLILGAGETAASVVRSLAARGVNQVIVANRHREAARKLAKLLNGKAVGLDKFPENLERADILVTATGSPHQIVSAEIIKAVMEHRQDRPVFILDLSVPRDVDPSAENLKNVYLYNVDNLERVTHENESRRLLERDRCQQLVNEEADNFLQWIDLQQVAPVIRELKRKVDDITNAEMEKALKTIRDSSPEAAAKAEKAVRRIIAKIIHGPISSLKDIVSEGEHMLYAEVVRKLFDLKGED